MSEFLRQYLDLCTSTASKLRTEISRSTTTLPADTCVMRKVAGSTPVAVARSRTSVSSNAVLKADPTCPTLANASASRNCTRTYSRYLRQYLHFCTSKASKLTLSNASASRNCIRTYSRYLRQYLYFCTSKASKLTLSKNSASRSCPRTCSAA